MLPRSSRKMIFLWSSRKPLRDPLALPQPRQPVVGAVFGHRLLICGSASNFSAVNQKRKAKMQSLESIIHEARAIRDMANAESNPNLVSAVINLSELVISLTHHVSNVRDTAGHAANVASCLANGIQPD